MLNHSTRPDKKPESVFDLAVDVGTSPHGLSASLPVPHQETFCASICHVPAKPVFVLGFFLAYCCVISFLFRAGAPAWLLNGVRLFVPDALMRAGARAYMQDHSCPRCRPSQGGCYE
jgi:hypothetical protein